jgi:hypothetical protein
MAEKTVKFGVKALNRNTMAQGRMISANHFSNFYLMEAVKRRIHTPTGPVTKEATRENPHFFTALKHFGDRPDRFLLDAQGKKLYEKLKKKEKKKNPPKKKPLAKKKEDTKDHPAPKKKGDKDSKEE